MEAEAFIAWCQNTLQAEHIVTGGGFRFGRGRKGDAALLQNMLGERYTAISPLLDADAKPYASSRIRSALSDAKLTEVTAGLGRPYAISGKVMHGQKRGRTLGFPTANLSLQGLHLPKFGVYAGWANVAGKRYKAAMNLGLSLIHI